MTSQKLLTTADRGPSKENTSSSVSRRTITGNSLLRKDVFEQEPKNRNVQRSRPWKGEGKQRQKWARAYWSFATQPHGFSTPDVGICTRWELLTTVLAPPTQLRATWWMARLLNRRAYSLYFSSKNPQDVATVSCSIPPCGDTVYANRVLSRLRHTTTLHRRYAASLGNSSNLTTRWPTAPVTRRSILPSWHGEEHVGRQEITLVR